MSQTAATRARVRELTALTDAYCQARLNADYQRLCRKAVAALAAERPPPFLRGRADIWAASILAALGRLNFLSDPSSQPHLARLEEIATHLGVSPASMWNKAKIVRTRLFPSKFEGSDFFTRSMHARFDPLFASMAALAESEDAADADGGPPPPTILRLLTGNLLPPGAPPPPGEFIDDDHPAAAEAYAKICDRYRRAGPTAALETALRRVITRDPDYFAPHLLLRAILRDRGQAAAAAGLLTDAAARIERRLTAFAAASSPSRSVEGDTDDNNRWPARLSWDWVENRHLLRLLLNVAIERWENGCPPAARALFHRLLRGDPGDALGARHYLLAMAERMSFADFEQRFSEGGCYTEELPAWFEANHGRHPEEFRAWQQALAAEEAENDAGC